MLDVTISVVAEWFEDVGREIFVSNICFIGKATSESYQAAKKSDLNIEEDWNEKLSQKN